MYLYVVCPYSLSGHCAQSDIYAGCQGCSLHCYLPWIPHVKEWMSPRIQLIALAFFGSIWSAISSLTARITDHSHYGSSKACVAPMMPRQQTVPSPSLVRQMIIWIFFQPFQIDCILPYK